MADVEKQMAGKPQSIDEYLAALSVDKRAALAKLREAIKAVAPEAKECISYGLAAFRLNGGPLVAFGASANHCSFYPMSSTIVTAHQDELKNYDTSKGTIRFAPTKPLPTALVRKLVKARIAESVGIRDRRAKPQAAVVKFDPAVDDFMRQLKHPLKKVVVTVRQLILSVSPVIQEGIKWNSPSFRTNDYFATLNLRNDRVWLILHTGAKVKASATKGLKIADPMGLLKWLAKDRCVVTLDDAKDVEVKRKALQSIIREWIKSL